MHTWRIKLILILIYLQIHHHHVDMLCYYKTHIFNCCVYRAAADTFVNDFTWTHCASCLFNTAWFIYMLLLIGLTFLTHPPQEKTYLKPRCTPLHTVSNPETVAKRWAPVWAWTCPWDISTYTHVTKHRNTKSQYKIKDKHFLHLHQPWNCICIISIKT